MVYIRSLHKVFFNGLLIVLSITFIKTKLVRFHDATKVYIYKHYCPLKMDVVKN